MAFFRQRTELAKCVSCKGKGLCDLPYCPVYAKMGSFFKKVDELEQNFSGISPPTVFIGSRLQYPNVNVGILSPPTEVEEAERYDSPAMWYDQNYTIRQIAELRSSLINSRFSAKVSDAKKNTKLIDLAKEIAAAKKPVSIDVELKKKPTPNFTFEKTSLPMGPAAALKNVEPKENISMSREVEKVVDDTDLKALEAIKYLHNKNFDEHKLTQLLSVGVLGFKKDRKFVPTRNSITAVDDALGKEIIKEIKGYEKIDECFFHYGSYFGNYYVIMFFPEIWGYELFETYLPGAVWNFTGQPTTTTDHEFYGGRKDYASNTVGGYYAARLPILNYLKGIKRQASILALRFETPEYTVPLGVFVVRQAARKTLESQKWKFSNKKEMVSYAANFAKKIFGFDITSILRESQLLKRINTQQKITNYS
ncbi:hypothetical protein HY643_05195 [Candidatus Woesearchaeota archaeon]|nr:hypothetical protein [Candidatus Woesearchaeota archaeon]